MRKTQKPRGKCPYCGRKVALTASGKVWSHRVKGSGPAGSRPFCGGSGHYPS